MDSWAELWGYSSMWVNVNVSILTMSTYEDFPLRWWVHVMAEPKGNSSFQHWIWDLDKQHGFSVSSLRKLLDSGLLQESQSATIWCRLVPIKANIFIWRSDVWEVVSRAFLWCLWNYRNGLVFEGKVKTNLHLLMEIKTVSYTWIRSRGFKFKHIDWNSWTLDPIL
ncbi:hypothetical protein LXL04_031559 [Taraxacum kok-saghyz]